MAEIRCEIVRHIAVIADRGNGWRLELNKVKWNDGPPKLDLRNWSKDYEKSSKQGSFTLEEMEALKHVLNELIPD